MDTTFHDHIASLDPLQADAKIARLAELNKQEDLEGLTALLQDILPTHEQVADWDVAHCQAAMRDIGFVVSSIRKLNVQPRDVNSEVEGVLLALGAKTGMVPRDTVYHYSAWNPQGDRLRTFTHFPDEKGLIESVGVTIPGLEQAAEVLDQLADMPVDDPRFSELCRQVSEHSTATIEGIKVAIKDVDPRVFAQLLRPYFDPIDVGNKSYVATGGGQIPLFLLDHAIWRTDADDVQHYFHFVDDSAAYLPPHLHKVYTKYQKSPSLLGKLEAYLADNPIDKNVDRSIEALKEVVKVMVKFRSPHQNYAKKSFTKDNIGKYDTGSGGYRMEFVNYVVDLTKGVYQRLSELGTVKN